MTYWITNQIGDGYLAVSFIIGLFISAIIFSWLGENKTKNKTKSWAIHNLDEKMEEDLLKSLK